MLPSICNNIYCAPNNHFVIFRYKWSNYSLCMFSLPLPLCVKNKQSMQNLFTIAHLNVVKHVYYHSTF